jgi:phosphoribosylformylglycinamidine cyclo-ligase
MEEHSGKGLYAEAGVDIDAGNKFVDILRPIVNKTFKPGVITDIGVFAGLFSLNLQHYRNPVLVSSTDGVGTKLKIAFMLDKHDTVGIDLVAMCVNDIMVQGAAPLFFLDYLAMGKLDLKKAGDIVKGIAAGCIDAQCALIGGETAEMPGLYQEGEYDLAGFVVGLADNEELLDGSEIAVGYKLIGIASSGLHSNGFSLVRKILFDQLKMSVDQYIDEFGRTLGEELLEPTKIYAKAISNMRRDFTIYGISHITGGGLIDNIPRMLPGRCKAVINPGSWTPQPIFSYLQDLGKIPEREMMRTFNNGLGLVIVVNEKETDDVLQRLEAIGEKSYVIGTVEAKEENEDPVQFVNA